jgi:SRSO17 transposase
MTLKQIAGLGRKLVAFLSLFADCFAGCKGRDLLHVYVKGQLSDMQRKTCETIALQFRKAPRTLQRFLESIKWDEEKMRDRCQQIIAKDHAHAEAIGIIDESGTAKSGTHTVGADRQYNGNRGKVETCAVAVHLSYYAPGFQCLLDSRMYLTEDYINDPVRRRENHVPDEIEFRTKPELAIEGVDRALENGIEVWAWTADELYGRDRAFLDAVESRKQRFVVEIPRDFHGWVQRPQVLRSAPKNAKKRGRGKKYPRVARKRPSSEVRDLVRYSPVFREQTWQRYRIKDTDRGPQVWEVKWAKFWRKDAFGLPTRRHCLIVARNVLTGEMKYFLSNRVPGERGVTLRRLLRVAFCRWSVESCFREAKEELGLDHYEVRGWRCVHRHFYVTQLSQLFCARIRQEYDQSPVDSLETLDSDAETNGPDRLTVEQVRRAMNAWLSAEQWAGCSRREHYKVERAKQDYYQHRNRQARESHTKTRLARLRALGIDADHIKSCL